MNQRNRKKYIRRGKIKNKNISKKEEEVGGEARKGKTEHRKEREQVSE